MASSQQKDDSKYDFQMPKFWDFTNSIPQKRPDESWFCKLKLILIGLTHIL